jgi:hypothetical protein
MARGGARQGAGRRKGQVSKQTQRRKEIAEQALAGGVSPLDVMLSAMRDAWANGDKKAAAGFAKEAAPYVHPRLAAVEHSGEMTLNQQEERLRALVSAPLTNGHDAAVQ